MSVDAGLFRAAIDLEARRVRVRQHVLDGGAPIDGVDFVEVLSNHKGTPGYVAGAPQQRTLLVHLVNGPVPTTWAADHVRIIGGERNDPALNPVDVVWAFPAEQVLDGSAGLPA